MQIVLSLLTALGVNQTIWIQLGCFLVSYLALTELVFKPYMKAYHEREKRTVGGEESAIRIVEEAQELTGHYEKRAREMNSEIKHVYDKKRSEALKDYEAMLAEARKTSSSLVEASRAKIKTEVEAARKKIAAEIPAVSGAIASRLAGKDLSV
jgi:F-type H+-transporting ATPase subunit b